MNSSEKRANYSYLINTLIGISLMILFRFIPAPEPITPLGMEIIGIFIGVIYLWTFVDSIWPSLLGIFLLGSSSFAPMNQVLMNFLGDSTVVQLFFMMVLIGAVVQSGLTNYIGRWFLTRKVINGKPWMFSFMVLLGVFALAATSSAFTPIFLFWPILYGIFKELGYKPKDKYPTLMLISVVVVALMGFGTAPFKDGPVILLNNYTSLTGIEISFASFIGLTIPLSLLSIGLLIVLMKFVLKPDISLLKDVSVEMFNKNPLPPLNVKHKIIATTFIVYILFMILPGILPADLPIRAFFNDNKFGFALVMVCILCAIKIDGKFLADYQNISSHHIQWSTIFLIGAALTIGNALTSEGTGVTPFLKNLLAPVFEGTGEFTFIVLILVLGLVLTNFCNSVVVGIIFLPIISAFTQTMGVATEPIVSIFIFMVLFGAITPAASPFAAIMHGNKEWLDTKDIYKYTTIMSILMLATVIIIGIPLSKIMF
ncbi:SLC13 family permease [Niameybacter massiliensis]|uniref:SLC13 family permease n=1 Tax=Niameybacter massiliensis TaxID=1658108 RepID=UPI0006B67315|nr:SLC13 family permease [Niameybacter massiliensis]